jgi:hypothetical protein
VVFTLVDDLIQLTRRLTGKSPEAEPPARSEVAQA